MRRGDPRRKQDPLRRVVAIEHEGYTHKFVLDTEDPKRFMWKYFVTHPPDALRPGGRTVEMKGIEVTGSDVLYQTALVVLHHDGPQVPEQDNVSEKITKMVDLAKQVKQMVNDPGERDDAVGPALELADLILDQDKEN